MTQPRVATSVAALTELLAGIAHVDGERLVIDDEARFRAGGIRDVVWTATFSEDADDRGGRALDGLGGVPGAGCAVGQHPRAVHGARPGRGARLHGAGHQPADPGLRHGARPSAQASMALDSGAVIFELARSEQEYTYQRPGEYITSVLAGAIAAGWQGPVFVQGDHYQFNAKKYAADPEGVTGALRKATVDALAVGYGNIDIDSSTLVDLSLDSVDAQQRTNYQRAAELSALIREHQADGLVVSIGGEIGEVGKENSTEAELRAYLDGYRAGARRARRCGRHRAVQGERPDGHLARWRAAAGRRRGGGQAGLRDAGAAVRGVPVVRPGGRRAARRVDAARRAVPPLPAGRDGRDPPRDGLPERALRPPRVPAPRCTPRSRPGASRTPRTSARGRDGQPVRVQDAQEGARRPQARAVGAADQGRDPGQPGRHM